jgi:hypothetical protein
MNRLFVLIVIFSVFYSKTSFSQNNCEIQIDKILKIKKAYIVTFSDTTIRNNTKCTSVSFFLRGKKDFNLLNKSNMFDYCLYLPSYNFISYLLANDRNSFNELFGNKTDYGDITKKKLKENGLFTLYSIESKKGFISWRISNQKFNEGLSIESIKIPSNIECLKVMSPNNIE